MDHPYQHADYPFNLIYVDAEGISWKARAREGKIVDAIKELRQKEIAKGNGNMPLREAKDVVEAYVNHVNDVRRKTLDPVRINDKVALHVTPAVDGGYDVVMVTTVAKGHVYSVGELMQLVAQVAAQENVGVY